MATLMRFVGALLFEGQSQSAELFFCGAGREIRAVSLKGNPSSLRPQCPGPPKRRKNESAAASETGSWDFAELTDNFSQIGPKRRIRAGTAARRGTVPTNE